MNYRNCKFKPSYETGIDDLVLDFYIPALEKAKRYDRIAGFFSSTSLALSARGLAGLIHNGGKMRMITCPRLEAADIEMIKSSIKTEDEVINEKCLDSLFIEDDFQKDHVAALGWMLENKFLDIRIALVYDENHNLSNDCGSHSPIMHQKVGVLYDEEWNGISFSGSINESASGWMNNIEEFKVFCSWKKGQSEYFESDKAKFDRLWREEHPSVKIKTLPQALSENLIERGKNFDIERIALDKYRNQQYTVSTYIKKKEELKLFFYQQNALDKWMENDRILLLEMATGCGKTRTAIACIKNLVEKTNRPLLVIVSCPGNTLSIQWKDDIEKLDVPIKKSVVCDGTNNNWRDDLEKIIKKVSTGLYKNALVYTTHQTCSSEDFINLINDTSDRMDIFFVGDEVHGMGAKKTQLGLLEKYRYRLGLSATPSRWFDDYGTELITNYFGNESFVFTIHDALTTINPITGKPFLVNYYYHPHFVSLTDDELEEYKRLSEKIIKMRGYADQSEIYENLLFKRADIEKKAENKYHELEIILDKIGNDLEDTIIFVSPEQKDMVLKMLAERNIMAHSFTEAESTLKSPKYGGKSEREYIISQFVEGNYKALVAIKCLDEGIDIPSAKRAIVMASSTNPREYVQRVGRVIRQANNKPNAEIYDLIIKPDIDNSFTEEFRKYEKRIFLKEMDRVLDISQNAINNTEVTNILYKVKGEIKL